MHRCDIVAVQARADLWIASHQFVDFALFFGFHDDQPEGVLREDGAVSDEASGLELTAQILGMPSIKAASDGLMS